MLLPAANRVANPWRNGAGWTRYIVSFEGDEEFDWLVSIAVVEGASEFSHFPRVDRFLVPLSPAGLRLEVDGLKVDLAQWQVFEFQGEQSVRSDVETGSTENLNLMLRRGTEGTLTVSRIAGLAEFEAAAGESVVVVLLDGRATQAEAELGRHDAVLLEETERITIEGDAIVAVARVADR